MAGSLIRSMVCCQEKLKGFPLLPSAASAEVVVMAQGEQDSLLNAGRAFKTSERPLRIKKAAGFVCRGNGKEGNAAFKQGSVQRVSSHFTQIIALSIFFSCLIMGGVNDVQTCSESLADAPQQQKGIQYRQCGRSRCSDTTASWHVVALWAPVTCTQ